jgi:ADP-dependent NAD(P)H-hydrate dehydratase / NAD(P)H-hydrate epimerase
MQPIVTPVEMAAIDQGASDPVEVLIRRAGSAVAWAARRQLGGTYGKRVFVIAGKGNNGADGRVAAGYLRRWGVVVEVIDAQAAPSDLPSSDLVIDAAYGTGLQRAYDAPATRAPVLAVDIPSGVDGLTGECLGAPRAAVETVTFQALKPGLLFHPGAGLVGELTVSDIGLDVSTASAALVERDDVAAWVPKRRPEAHKWQSACWVIAGSPSMTGAAHMAAAAAQRSGAGYVRLSIPGTAAAGPLESVRHDLPAEGWERGLSTDLGRFGSVVLGPGLGRARPTRSSVRRALAAIDVPVVLDGDGLAAIARAPEVLDQRPAPTVLTPHDGEFELLMRRRPGPDRLSEARAAAATLGSIVLLKGPATVVAEPEGRCLVVTAGDERLATAGTGDVLAGIIGALLANGVDPFKAAAAGAWLHGQSAMLRPRRGLVANDLIDALAEVWDATDLG